MWIAGAWLVDIRSDGEEIVAIDKARCALVRVDPGQRTLSVLKQLERKEHRSIEDGCPWSQTDAGPLRLSGAEISASSWSRTLDLRAPPTDWLYAGNLVLPVRSGPPELLPLRAIAPDGRDVFVASVTGSDRSALDADPRTAALLSPSSASGSELVLLDANTGDLRATLSPPIGAPAGVQLAEGLVVAYGSQGAALYSPEGRLLRESGTPSWGATAAGGQLVTGHDRVVTADRWQIELSDAELPAATRALDAAAGLVLLQTTDALTALSPRDGAVRWRWGLLSPSYVGRAGHFLVITEPDRGTAIIDLSAPQPERTVTLRGHIQASEPSLLPAVLWWGDRQVTTSADGRFTATLEGRGMARLSIEGQSTRRCARGWVSRPSTAELTVDLEGPSEISREIALLGACVPLDP